MAMTNYLEDKLLEAVVKNTSYTTPTTVYMALYSTAPGEAGGGTELSGDNYSRAAMTFGSSSGGTITTTADITFATASGDWATAVAIGIVDASSGGNLLFYKSIAGRSVKSGSALTIVSGDITLTLD